MYLPTAMSGMGAYQTFGMRPMMGGVNPYSMGMSPQQSYLPQGLTNPYMQQNPTFGMNPMMGGGISTMGMSSPGMMGQNDSLGLPPEISSLANAGMGNMGDPVSAMGQMGLPIEGASRPGANPLMQGTTITPMAANIIAGIMAQTADTDPNGVMHLISLTQGDPSLMNNYAYRDTYERIRQMYNAAGIGGAAPVNPTETTGVA